MALIELRIHTLRNIRSLSLQAPIGTNLIHGSNGSGKTTILEAIFLLARAKSFRSNRIGPLVTQGEKQLTIYGKIEENQLSHRIGITKQGRETTIRIDGQRLTRSSELAKILPVQIFTPHSHQIIERGPEYRRRFVEWGVFHVEPNYLEQYRRMHRALLQRNSALRTSSHLDPWDLEFAEAGEPVNRYREQYINALKEYVTEEVQEILPDYSLSLDWKRGWSAHQTLLESLQAHRKSDRDKGFTQLGPHRADLHLLINGRKASDVASRGQQKMIVFAIKMAQMQFIATNSQIVPILLVDDITAELDRDNLYKMLDRIDHSQSQCFITTTDPYPFDVKSMAGVFHVEHGSLHVV